MIASTQSLHQFQSPKILREAAQMTPFSALTYTQKALLKIVQIQTRHGIIA
jgi:hypothetical protein